MKRRLLAMTTVLCLVLGAAAAVGPMVGRAAADGDSGASSRVTPGGDILTAILLPRSTRKVPGRGPRSGASVTWWHTLTDAELSYVLAVAAGYPELEVGFLDGLEAAVNDLGRDLQVEMSADGPTGRTRVIDAPPGDGGSAGISREMITRLSTPDLEFSPAREVALPLREPVFVHVPAATWAATRTDVLSAGGVTAVVRAHRRRMEIYSGDPGTRFDRLRCDGPGRAYDRDGATGPQRQANAPGACTFSYRTATGTGDRRDRWYGVVTIVWDAEWSRDGGVTWSPLGEIPESQIFTRRVRPVLTRIESR